MRAAAKAFIAECEKRNVVIMGAGVFGNCVRFLPPLNINDADMDIAMGIFDEAAKVAFAEAGSRRLWPPCGAALGRAAGRSSRGRPAARPFRRARLGRHGLPSRNPTRFTTQVRVRYADTDAAGVVYYAIYLTYFEVARVELLRSWACPSRGGGTRPAAAGGGGALKYLRPARLDDLLDVSLWVEAIGRASFAFGYEVTRDGLLLVTGLTRRPCASARPGGRPHAGMVAESVWRHPGDGNERLMSSISPQPGADMPPDFETRMPPDLEVRRLLPPSGPRDGRVLRELRPAHLPRVHGPGAIGFHCPDCVAQQRPAAGAPAWSRAPRRARAGRAASGAGAGFTVTRALIALNVVFFLVELLTGASACWAAAPTLRCCAWAPCSPISWP